MATKQAVPGTSEPNWMTTYVPKAKLITDEEGNLIEPNDRLEQQRAEFEAAENEQQNAVEEQVRSQVADLRDASHASGKSVSEILETNEEDESAIKDFEEEARSKAKKQAETDKEEAKKTAQRAATTAKSQAEKQETVAKANADAGQPSAPAQSKGVQQGSTGNEKAAAKK
jgi:hypothetical protein